MSKQALLLINHELSTETKKTINGIHMMPHILDQEAIERNIYVSDFDESAVPQQEGKVTEMFYDTVTNTITYEFVDRPLTDAEKLVQMEYKQSLMQQAIDDLIFGGTF